MSTTSLSEYGYESFKNENEYIRLLTVAPRSKDSEDHISCKLSICKFDGAEKKHYRALSYTWGEIPKDRWRLPSIAIDGHRFSVSENLYAVLEHIANKLWENDEQWQGRNIWWIDAVCINQNDEEEKSAQMDRMRDIYFVAEEVIAWVGPRMTEIARMMRNQSPGLQTRDAFSKALDDEAKRDYIVGAIKDLFRSPYWSRLWILQELAVASKTQLVCGGGELHWKKFVDVATWIAAMNKQQPSVVEMQSLVVRYQPVWLLSLVYQEPRWRERLNLAKLVYMSKHALVTDTRDRIRGLLGLVASGANTLPASIDGDSSKNWSACTIICHAIRQICDDMYETKKFQKKEKNKDSKKKKWNKRETKDCRSRAEDKTECEHEPLKLSPEVCAKRRKCGGVKCGALATCRVIATILYEQGTLYSGRDGKNGPMVRYALNGLWQRRSNGWGEILSEQEILDGSHQVDDSE